jgi:hypothetical protein
MAAHSVKLKMEHPLAVGNLGVEFEVRRGGKLLGKLEVTQSTIEWTPAKARNPRKKSWQEFGEWMEGPRREPAARAAKEGLDRPTSAGAEDVEDEVDDTDPGDVDGIEAADVAADVAVADDCDDADLEIVEIGFA